MPNVYVKIVLDCNHSVNTYDPKGKIKPGMFVVCDACKKDSKVTARETVDDSNILIINSLTYRGDDAD